MSSCSSVRSVLDDFGVIEAGIRHGVDEEQLVGTFLFSGVDPDPVFLCHPDPLFTKRPL